MISIVERLKSTGNENFVKVVLKKTLRIIAKYLDTFLIFILKSFPIDKHCIVLESEGDYTESIRVFYDFLLSNKLNEKYKIIWLVHSPKNYKNMHNVQFISRYHYCVNFKADFYLATAKFFIFSHPYWFRNWRKEQIVIHTTHSVAQLKGVNNPIKEKIFDYVLVCSDYCAEIKIKNYPDKYDSILKLGMPRLDLMYQHKECLPELVQQYNGEKLILSMATFKQRKSEIQSDSTYEDKFAINVVASIEELKTLDAFLKKNNCIMLVKIHHLQNMDFIKDVSLDNIVYLTDEELLKKDIQVNQILENADVLLTDYSSVFYDYLIKNRPIGFMVSDLESYKRGFICENPFDEMPGEKIYDCEGLLHFIKESLEGKDDYKQEREKIRAKVFDYNDAKNCERLYRWIEEKIKEGE